MEKTLKIIPQSERILVKPIVVSNKSAGGIILATEGSGAEGKIMTTFATIVAISSDLEDKHKLGETVYHNPRAGVGITLNCEKYLILTDMEILAKIEVDADNLENAIRNSAI